MTDEALGYAQPKTKTNVLNGLSLINCEEGKAELRLILIQSSLSCNVNASHSSNGWHTVALNAPQVMKFYAVN